MNVVVATLISTLMRWWRASLLASPIVVPASTVPCRGMVPVRVSIASNRLVLPLWNGPTSAMHRGPVGLVPFCPITASLGAYVFVGAAFISFGPSPGSALDLRIVSGDGGDWQVLRYWSFDARLSWVAPRRTSPERRLG